MSRDYRHVDPMVRQCEEVGMVEENSELRLESLEFPVSRRQKGTDRHILGDGTQSRSDTWLQAQVERVLGAVS